MNLWRAIDMESMEKHLVFTGRFDSATLWIITSGKQTDIIYVYSAHTDTDHI